MEFFEFIREWFKTHPTTTDIVKYVVWLLFVLIFIRFLRRFFKKNITDTSARYKTQKGVEIAGYLFIVFITISYFTGNIKDFTLAIGLFSAGIAITLQELFLSIAGSIYIFLVKVYAPGDRIEINGPLAFCRLSPVQIVWLLLLGVFVPPAVLAARHCLLRVATFHCHSLIHLLSIATTCDGDLLAGVL